MNDRREFSPTTTPPDVAIAETIAQGCSERGGWNKPQLALIGVVWPPIKGWRKLLDESGIRVPCEVHEQFIALRGKTVRRPIGSKLTNLSKALDSLKASLMQPFPGTPRPDESYGPQQTVVRSQGDR